MHEKPDNSEAAAMNNKLSAATIAYLRANAVHVGLDVKFPPEMSYLPCLEARDGSLVPLYQVIEAIDGQVDIEEAVKDVRGLSYIQVAETLDFVRAILQGNTKGVDVDAVEDAHAIDCGLVAELEAAMDDDER